MMPPHPDLTVVKAGSAVARPGETDLFTVCRNEAHLLPHFLHHYRTLGVDRIYVIDNASTDGTAALLAGMEDVWHLHTTAHYFSANDGCDWVRAVVEAEAPGRWGIFADADELLVWPGCEDIPLPVLVDALEATGAEGLFAFMLDFYAPALFDTTPYHPGTPFTEAAPHFDGSGYVAGFPPEERARSGESPNLFIRGGVRHRLLDWEALGKRPTLRKVPLAKATGGQAPWTGSHSVTQRQLASFTGALLHFKFLGKSGDILREDVEADGRGAHQPVYEHYLKVWEDGAPNPMDDVLTQTWRDSLHLVELGLCALPPPALKALRAALKEHRMRRVWQPVMQRLMAASDAAQGRFRPEPGHVFQIVTRF
jgi:hypothetical protein